MPSGDERPPLPAVMKGLGLAISLRLVLPTEMVTDGTVRSSRVSMQSCVRRAFGQLVRGLPLPG
jgi:hypothetical protein